MRRLPVDAPAEHRRELTQMSGDRPIRPVHGIAAGCRYVALPPTAVDAVASGPTRLMVIWPGFDPPRTAEALAASVPLTGVPVWRVYLDLPAQLPGGLGSAAILDDSGIELYGAAVEQAAGRLPEVVDELGREFAVPDGPVALAGFSTGGAAALLAVARGDVPVGAAAAVAPVVAPGRAARAVEKRAGRDRSWTDASVALADRLDLGALAGDIAARDAELLLVGGAKDRVVPSGELNALRDALQRHGAAAETVSFRMGHALAAEPGTEARPPITEAVRVDGVLSEWFRDRLAATSDADAPDVADAGSGDARGDAVERHKAASGLS
ncbi:hypothetical protein ACFHW2_10080 [Actinomadura sp. LOL_016]|uniref:hypothetical protein n=1 Tax=Actinomadura sp. LOL_016 TaxID=3345411 RepID=UPI003A849D3B